MIQCISNAMETNHSPQCQLPTGKSRCYISILTRNAFVHNCTMHNALHHCTIAQFQCTTRFQCTTDCVVKKTCYAICGKHLLLNVGMWGWFKGDQLKYDHVAARKAWPQPLKSSINAPPKPALPSSAYDQLTWSHTSDLWSNQTKQKQKTATSTFLSPIAFINFATWLTLKI